MNTPFLAGYAKVNYTPDFPVGGSGYYVRGTAEKMADRMVHLLEEVK